MYVHTVKYKTELISERNILILLFGINTEKINIKFFFIHHCRHVYLLNVCINFFLSKMIGTLREWRKERIIRQLSLRQEVDVSTDSYR